MHERLRGILKGGKPLRLYSKRSFRVRRAVEKPASACHLGLDSHSNGRRCQAASPVLH